MSAFWTALVRDSDIIDEQDEKPSNSTLRASTEIFLDFLYPSLNFIRQHSSWRPDSQSGHQRRARSGRLGQRLYTSLARAARFVHKDSNTMQNIVEGGDAEISVVIAESTATESKSASAVLQSLSGVDDYEEAWRSFENSDTTSRKQLAPDIFAYLSTSNRLVDAKRSISVFGHFEDVATRNDYRNLIRLYLLLGDVENAMWMGEAVVNKFKTPSGSDLLLAHALSNSNWELACNIWTSFQIYSIPRRRLGQACYNIWKSSDNIQNLPDRAVDLLQFMKNKTADSSNTSISPEVGMLLSEFANKALLVMAGGEDIDQSKFNALLDSLEQQDTPKRFEHIISALLQSSHTKIALQTYRRYRKHIRHVIQRGSNGQKSVTLKISRAILTEMLEVACKYHSVLGMQQTLEDWFHFYKTPSLAAYRLCMTTFAAQGDVPTVRALFNQYKAKMERAGEAAVTRADDLAPLLQVYARRGRLSEVRAIFDGMKENFGVEPNTMSWNMLLATYGRVHDVDGAFEQFEAMLNSSVEPDTYTIGTMMGICTTRGDLESALELYQMAETNGIPRSAAMVDCLVLGHIQDDRLEQAEKICEDALEMGLEAPVTRMWNYLLTAYALRSDLNNTNRIARRMKDVAVKYDGSTYSALMQALVMVNQPDRAKQILTDVLLDAGIKITSFHYAVVMGGYLATGELKKLFDLQRQMLKRDIMQSPSTQLITRKARSIEGQRRGEIEPPDSELAKADQYFLDAYNTVGPPESTDNPKKGIGRQPQPLGVAYSSAYYSYLIFVLGKRNAFGRATELYERFMKTVPASYTAEPSVKLLSAMMIVNYREKNYEGVQAAWELVFERAKKQGQPINFLDLLERDGVLPLHQLALTNPLSTQILSLAQQKKFGQLARTIKDVEAAGFVIDNKNWNIYIQQLSGSHRYKLAFQLCEAKLMDGWTGWARLRWPAPERNRLPLELRNERSLKPTKHLRPLQHTLLYMARAYLELQDTAPLSGRSQLLLDEITKQCPRTVGAIRTMERIDDDVERKILGLG
jgi:pentatricopeptide repeat-containing protein PET309